MIRGGTFRIQTTDRNGTYTKEFSGRNRVQEKIDYDTLFDDPYARVVVR